MSRSRIVVATPDVLGERMAGPAVRAWRLAGVLAEEHDVELVSREPVGLPAGRFPVRQVSRSDVAELVARTDAWVVQGSVLADHPAIAAGSAPVAVDLYDPYHLEKLEQASDRSPRDRRAAVHNATTVLNASLLRGDLFLAASARQRDFWLGSLAALGRVNPSTYDADPTLASLVAVVPFGTDAEPPATGRPALRGVVPGIGHDDLVLLWGGGLHNWLDPLTLVRAVERVGRERDDVRLVFLGARNPNPRVPAMRVAAETRALADELGLTGRTVFFPHAWVPYEERGALLAEADVGVSTHLDHVETAYSFRTRVLDYLWAGLPVVATAGDVLADQLVGSGAGIAVPPGDVDALAAALLAYAEDPAARVAAGAASRALGETYAWPLAAAPLLAWCRDPRRAPDLVDPEAARLLAEPGRTVRAPTPAPGWRGEVALARQYLADGGTGLLARRAAARAGKLVRGRRD